MLELLGVSSSNLTYHLESLGELVAQEGGVYKLSTFGSAAVGTMKIVEEAPEVQPRKRGGSLKWKMALGVLMVGIIVLASVSAIELDNARQAYDQRNSVQLKYNQLLSWSSTTNQAITFLQQVAQIDTSRYQATLLCDTVQQRADLGGALEQVMTYSLSSSDSQLPVVFRFRNGQLSRYQIIVLDGGVVYSEAQPYSVLDAAKNLLGRLASFENASYLANMTSMLSLASTSMQNMQITEGNIVLNVTISGSNAQIVMLYTQSGVDFSPKNLTLIFSGNDLTQLTDDWYLFTIGSTTVNVDSNKALQIALNAVKSFSWNSNGTSVSNFVVLSQPVSVVFHPNTKNGLALYPQWTVTLYLDKVYPGGVNTITVLVWADTGDVAQIQTGNG